MKQVREQDMVKGDFYLLYYGRTYGIKMYLVEFKYHRYDDDKRFTICCNEHRKILKGNEIAKRATDNSFANDAGIYKLTDAEIYVHIVAENL